MDFLIADFGQATKTWFTALIPVQQLNGTISGRGNPQLEVDLNPVPVKDGIDVDVFKVSVAISPQAHRVFTVKLASSSARTAVKSWGVA